MKHAHSEFEQKLWSQNIEHIVGIDEVGRGCWAGPLVVGAVIFPKHFSPDFILADSKKLSAKKRAFLTPLIYKSAISWTIIEISVDIINKRGVGKAAQEGFRKAVDNMSVCPEHILIDAFKIKTIPETKQTAIIKGDEQSISIAAASIIAKEYRDEVMRQIHHTAPEYGFDRNVGYGTQAHRNALAKWGLSEFHRKSYDLSRWLTISV